MPDLTEKHVKTGRPKPKPVTGADDQSRLRQACAELKMSFAQVFAWKIYPDRIVILFETGQKLVWRQP